jgi:hypothetical protein
MSGFLDERDDLDRVLRGLGSVKSPSGMEMRVLAAVRGAEAGKAAATGGMWGWRFGVGGIALAAMVLVAFGVHGLRARQDGRLKEARGGSVAALAPVRARSEAEAPEVTERKEERSALSEGAGRDGAAESREVRAARVHVNLPAPEAPLTEQERLLYQLADQVTRPEQVALEAGAGTQSEAAERQEFNEFFPARTQIEQPVQVAQDLQPSLEQRRK